MPARQVTPRQPGALSDLDANELLRLAHAAEHLLSGRPRPEAGARTARLRAGVGTEFLDYRAYQPGDDIRRVDWRASGRGDHTVVRRHIEEVRSDWLLCLDASASMAAGDHERWRHAVLLAAAFSHVLLHLGHRAGLALYDDRARLALAPGRGHQHLARLLRTLCDSQPAQSGGASAPASCRPWLRHASTVVLISDLLPAQQQAQELSALSAACGELHVLHVVGNDATEATGDGPARLVDAESGERISVMRHADLREQVAAAGRHAQDLLAARCRRIGAAYSACPVTRRWSANVTSHLQSLGRPRA